MFVVVSAVDFADCGEEKVGRYSSWQFSIVTVCQRPDKRKSISLGLEGILLFSGVGPVFAFLLERDCRLHGH